MPWTVETLDKRVDRELDGLPSDMKARFFRIGGLLEEGGPLGVGMLSVHHLKDDLWKMRLSGQEGIARALFLVTSRHEIVVFVYLQEKDTDDAGPRDKIG
jgi:hypothetical protein